jgi:DnaJ-domain-containing protein 1
MEKAAPHSRFKTDIRIRKGAVKQVSTRACARPECSSPGTHRVPKSRDNLNEHLWFCLEHARAHNEAWDYFMGMSEAEIESFRTDAITGHRPTWPLGRRAAYMRNGHGSHEFVDGYEVFSDVEDKPKPRAPERRLTRPQSIALETLNLDASATLQEIKARYKELVKRFHPDANGGDRGAEERLKQVIKAYGVLRAAGLT